MFSIKKSLATVLGEIGTSTAKVAAKRQDAAAYQRLLEAAAASALTWADPRARRLARASPHTARQDTRTPRSP